MCRDMKVIPRGKIRFLLLFLLYLAVVLATSRDTFMGDESEYVAFATNLSHGYYSPPGSLDLWFGPGYPMVLLPFVLLRLPWLAAKVLNAVFLIGAVIYFYRTLRLYMGEDQASVIGLLFGIYPPLLREVSLLLSESLVFFLVCGFLFNYCRTHREREHYWGSLLTASAFLGYLALTKVFFGYVILAGIAIFLLVLLVKRGDAGREIFLGHAGRSHCMRALSAIHVFVDGQDPILGKLGWDVTVLDIIALRERVG
jgi:hypothetical protein